MKFRQLSGLWVSRLGFGVSLLVFVLALIGHLSPWVKYRNNAPPRAWEAFDPALVESTHSVDDLLMAAQERTNGFAELDDQQKMIALFEVVTQRFTHGTGAQHTLATNWVAATAGLAHPTLGTVFDADTLVARGHALVCSQSSYVLVQLANRAGIRARHVGLDGHVVMEAWYDDAWHLFDPDMEVVPFAADGSVLSTSALASREDLLVDYYPGDRRFVVETIRSEENNSYASHPVGVYFEWKSQVLLYAERATQILKFLVPLAGMAGWGIRLRRDLHASKASPQAKLPDFVSSLPPSQAA